MKLKNALSNLLHLFYPHICAGCASDLLDENNLLCLKCINTLPHTNYAQHANNQVEKIFWGRIPLAAAHSQFYFTKASMVQELIHQLKYKNNQAIGIYLGEMLGNSLLSSNRFTKIDALVPLPMYADKQHKRGYNQAAVICRGMSAVMNVPVINNVHRQYATATQTRKNRAERWENVAGSFTVKNADQLAGKHLLLVDDVLTTGATLEAAGNTILQAADTKLSIATVAFATK
ncbi:MAG TPA: phosphoribosyltransferase family protein [Ferruginibacter sp.]|jgi:ComF family protein|nr:phosphoribosyltransferase family protein [Ferruginibacter sp.]